MSYCAGVLKFPMADNKQLERVKSIHSRSKSKFLPKSHSAPTISVGTETSNNAINVAMNPIPYLETRPVLFLSLHRRGYR